LEEVGKVTEVSRGLGGKLRQRGKRLSEIVDSLNKVEILALTDELTQIANRRAWDNRLLSEFNRFQRYNRPCILVMLDLDDFKNINDTYGHQIGDQALREVARILGEGLRVTDFPARYGGEEFSLLLPETSLAAGALVAEKLRKNIAETKFTVRGQITPLTASFGVSSFGDRDLDGEAALQRADRAMYLAKSQGKNLVRSEEDLEAAEASMAEKELK
jgi:diguanylate cyclase